MGQCTSMETYALTINFEVINPGNDYFEVSVRNNVILGYYTNCSLKVRIYLEGKFFEIKAENVDIALVTASLPDCAKQTGLSNEDIGKFFSKITVIIYYNLYKYKFVSTMS